MLSFLPPVVRGTLVLLGILLHTIFWCVPIYILALLKLLIPVPAWREQCSRWLISLAENWISTNSLLFWLTQKREWEITGLENLQRDHWYLVSSNHQSWTDIVVLQTIFNRRIPFLKFFIKYSLIKIPFLGLAWWALDFPFMQRYSKAYLQKFPEKKGMDLEITRRACAKFQKIPTSVMNFLEGSRFSPEKKAQQDSPYAHLLRPKAGGIAFVLSVMGEQLRSMLNVTIVYENNDFSFWDFLCGRVTKIRVHIEHLELPARYFHGDYAADPAFREEFQAWVNNLWAEKDELISRMQYKDLSYE